MEKEVLKRIFEFLEEKESKSHQAKGTLLWKIVFNEPLTKEDLNVKGDLNLEKSKITSLPKGLKVGGNLSLYASKIESLPKELEVGGDLGLNVTSIKSLPEGLKLGGDLDLNHSNIRSLPEGLKIHRDLNLYNSKIKILPKGLEVGGNLYIKSTDLTKYTEQQLREMIKPGFIKGRIYTGYE